MPWVLNSVLGLYRRIYKLLRCLLKLFFGCLRIRIGNTCLVLNLDMNGLPRHLLDLLALRRLISNTAIHGVVHHAPIKGVALLPRLLLRLVSGDDRSSYYSKGR